MKKIINGKSYNTETAIKCGSWANSNNFRDFDYVEETLYRKKPVNFSCMEKEAPTVNMQEFFSKISGVAAKRSCLFPTKRHKNGQRRSLMVTNMRKFLAKCLKMMAGLLSRFRFLQISFGTSGWRHLEPESPLASTPNPCLIMHCFVKIKTN